MVSYRLDKVMDITVRKMITFIFESCFPEAYRHYKCPMGSPHSQHSATFHKTISQHSAQIGVLLYSFFEKKKVQQYFHSSYFIEQFKKKKDLLSS